MSSSKLATASILFFALAAHPIRAATIYLADAADGDGVMELALDCGTGVIDVRLDTAAIDTIKVAFVHMWFDSSDPDLDAFDVEHGLPPPFFYVCEFCGDFPAPLDGISHDSYQLEMGDNTFEGGLPLGSATWVLDSVTVGKGSCGKGEALVTFEQAARHVTLFGPGPEYLGFEKAGDDDTLDLPDHLYEGVGNNVGPIGYEPFIVRWVPEPASGMLWLAVAIASGSLRRQRP